MKAYWTDGPEVTVSSQSDLDAVVATVRSLGEPTMLFLEHEDGRILVVGLGAPESVLTFVEADGTSFHSVGDLSRTGVLKFWCRDQLDDFLAEMAVPEATAVAAASSFVAEQAMPANIAWEADW